jgi:hypothetical protein
MENGASTIFESGKFGSAMEAALGEGHDDIVQLLVEKPCGV